jgi:hypothetical protein
VKFFRKWKHTFYVQWSFSENGNIHFMSSEVFFRKWKHTFYVQWSFSENGNIHFMSSEVFPKVVSFRRLCGKIRYSQTGHRCQYSTAHALCMLDIYGYRHILRTCNTCCFSTATVVTRTRVSVHVLRTLPFLLLYYTSVGKRYETWRLSQYESLVTERYASYVEWP